MSFTDPRTLVADWVGAQEVLADALLSALLSQLDRQHARQADGYQYSLTLAGLGPDPRAPYQYRVQFRGAPRTPVARPVPTAQLLQRLRTGAPTATGYLTPAEAEAPLRELGRVLVTRPGQWRPLEMALARMEETLLRLEAEDPGLWRDLQSLAEVLNLVPPSRQHHLLGLVARLGQVAAGPLTAEESTAYGGRLGTEILASLYHHPLTPLLLQGDQGGLLLSVGHWGPLLRLCTQLSGVATAAPTWSEWSVQYPTLGQLLTTVVPPPTASPRPPRPMDPRARMLDHSRRLQYLGR